MKKYLELAEKIQKECEIKALSPSIKCQTANLGEDEAFFISYAGGVVTLKYSHEPAKVYGLNFLSVVCQSKHWPEYLGLSKARFTLRPLWIGCTTGVIVTDKWGFVLPPYFDNLEAVDSLCKRVLELGCNALVIGARDESFVEAQMIPLEKINYFFQLLSEYGIHIIVKPFFNYKSASSFSRCPMNTAYRQYIQEIASDLKRWGRVQSVWLEGHYLHSDFRENALEATLLDLAAAEVKLWEEFLGDEVSLIYYASTKGKDCAKQQAEWLTLLCDEMGKNTTLAFPVVAGDPTHDHLPMHPIWNTLRESSDESGTGLLPVLNIGGVNQGEGLWPALYGEFIDHLVNRCHRHHFKGIVGLVNQVPLSGGILDCNLWIFGQSLWRHTSSRLLAETWFQVFKQDWVDDFLFAKLSENRQIILQLSWIRMMLEEKENQDYSLEEGRAFVEGLWGRLKLLELRNENLEKKRMRRSSKLDFCDYMTYFLRDARRILISFAHAYNITLQYSKEEDQNQESFWTQGNKWKNEEMFLNEPRMGTNGSRMEQIYYENRKV